MAIKKGDFFRMIEQDGKGKTQLTVSISGASVMPDGQVHIINEQQSVEGLIYMGFGLSDGNMGLIVGNMSSLQLLAFMTWLRKSVGDERLDKVLALSRLMNMTRHLDEIEEKGDARADEAPEKD